MTRRFRPDNVRIALASHLRTVLFAVRSNDFCYIAFERVLTTCSWPGSVRGLMMGTCARCDSWPITAGVRPHDADRVGRDLRSSHHVSAARAGLPGQRIRTHAPAIHNAHDRFFRRLSGERLLTLRAATEKDPPISSICKSSSGNRDRDPPTPP